MSEGFVLGRGFLDMTARDTRLNRTLRRVESRLARTQAALQGVARTARRMFLIGAVAVGYFVKQAMSAEEIASKFRQVFGEQAKAAEQFVQRTAKYLGRSIVDLRTMMSLFQDTLYAAMGDEPARRLSQSLTTLTLDLASFNDRAEPSVMRDLQSALTGMYRTMRKYGVIMTAATLNQELLNMGIKGGAKAATEAEKIQARFNQMVAMSSKALGDAKRTEEEATNQLRKLRGEFKDASVAIGNAFLPVVVRLMKAFIPVLRNVADWVKHNEKLLVSYIKWGAAIAAILIVLPKLIGLMKLLAAAALLVARHTKLSAAAAVGVASVALGYWLHRQTLNHWRFKEAVDATTKALDRELTQIDKLTAGYDRMTEAQKASVKGQVEKAMSRWHAKLRELADMETELMKGTWITRMTGRMPAEYVKQIAEIGEKRAEVMARIGELRSRLSSLDKKVKAKIDEKKEPKKKADARATIMEAASFWNYYAKQVMGAKIQVNERILKTEEAILASHMKEFAMLQEIRDAVKAKSVGAIAG